MLVWGIASAFGATVKWTTYQDDQCTVLCPLGGTACETTADTSVTCNQNSEASWNNLVCHSDYITYDNFPNTGSNQGTYSACDTSVTCIQNLLHVGVCQYFPGPVSLWSSKYSAGSLLPIQYSFRCSVRVSSSYVADLARISDCACVRLRQLCRDWL